MSASDPYAALGERLRGLLEAGGRAAADRGEPVLVSTVAAIPAPDHSRLFQRSEAEERAHWEQPDEGFSLTAIGSAARLVGHGDHRFPDVTAAWRSLRSGALLDTAEGFPLALPIALGGFAFHPAGRRDPDWSGFADGLLLVPRLLFVSHRGASWLCLSQMATPGGDAIATADSALAELRRLLSSRPPEEEGKPSAGDLRLEEEVSAGSWRDAVGRIVEEIGHGPLEKAVLARQVRVRSAAPLDPGPVLDRLRTGYSGCTIFAFAFGHTTFLGATPERLIRLDGQRLRADCLAGSTARGANEQEDRSLGEALLADAKERHEHSLVVRAAREALAPLCSQLSVADTPTLLKMPTVQHLHTPVEGSLRGQAHLLDLVAQLHPTPASGGLPRAAAVSLIREHEPFDRGWYAGPVGWIDGSGDGEFVVAIRSALLREREALLYAGCGIVAGSDPDHEYQESCLKLRAMLWALNGQRS